jgi:hypothetical protein
MKWLLFMTCGERQKQSAQGDRKSIEATPARPPVTIPKRERPDLFAGDPLILVAQVCS